MQAQDPIIGKRIGGYRVTTFIAHGSYGPIYYAERSFPTGRSVAIKLLYSLRLGTQPQYDQFLQEVQALKALKHPHILPVLDADLYNGIPYLVTGYAPNASLRYRLWQLPGHILPLSEAVNILACVGQALHYAHQQNTIHGNLKPENILFDAEGEVLLADFGIATLAATAGPHHRNTISTAPYMAPEQFDGVLSSASDQYALGCIAYETMTGRFPFTAPDVMAMRMVHKTAQPVPPIQLKPDLPVHAEQAILKAMAKQWNDRYVDVSAFTMALRLPTSGAARQANEWLDKGNVFNKEKHYQEALVAYERVIQLIPNFAGAYHSKGNALYSLRQYEKALTVYERAIQLDPNLALAYCGKCNALCEMKRCQEALAASERAIQLDPNLAFAYYSKGSALRGLKRYEEALITYERAIHLDPGMADIYVGKGIAFSELKHYKEAFTAFQQALQLDVNCTFAYNNRGNTFFELKRYEEALTDYERAIQLEPHDAVYHSNKGSTLLSLRRYEEALVACEYSIQLNPDFAYAFTNKALALRGLSRYEEAYRAIERAIQLDPEDVIILTQKGNSLRSPTSRGSPGCLQ